nr:copper amine oxidase N-terminal domain-containing protein [uncultured Niameybacter sp.]
MVLKDSNTLVPLRFCSEELKAVVNWDKSTQQITIEKDSNTLVFKLGSLNYTHNAENKSLLVAPTLINGITYVPFRPLVKALNGVVLYNNQYKFINIYDVNSNAYKVYKSLNSKNLIEQRFALLEAPSKSFDGSYGGSRANTYIFPLGETSNYFFRYFSDEGYFYGMDYFEVHDGVAVQKWGRTQAGSTPTSLAQSPLLNYLGTGSNIKENGSFPNLNEDSFVRFYNSTFEASKDNISSMYSIGNTVSFLNEQGCYAPDLNTPNKLIFSPFNSLYYLVDFNEK